MTEWIIKIKRIETLKVRVSADTEEDAKQKARTEQGTEHVSVEIIDATRTAPKNYEYPM